MTGTQPLRDEHAELVPHIAALAEAADAVGTLELAEVRRLVDESYHFLAHQLIPHAHAEEAALYPAVQRAVGAAEMTATMSRDHVEVQALTDELGRLRTRLAEGEALDDDTTRALRRVLYGLHHLVKVHFAKEEEVYLPLLEAHLTEDDFVALFATMGEAAGHHH
jgi:hemerythrin-like domain-containing protein